MTPSIFEVNEKISGLEFPPRDDKPLLAIRNYGADMRDAFTLVAKYQGAVSWCGIMNQWYAVLRIGDYSAGRVFSAWSETPEMAISLARLLMHERECV